MSTYRVPVDLTAPPAPPQFVDVKDFWEKMFDALGIYARLPVAITTAGGAVVRPVTDCGTTSTSYFPAPVRRRPPARNQQPRPPQRSIERCGRSVSARSKRRSTSRPSSTWPAPQATDREMTEPLIYTAYPSGPTGEWTVWDHLHDQAVTTGRSEAAAIQLADQLEHAYWAS